MIKRKRIFALLVMLFNFSGFRVNEYMSRSSKRTPGGAGSALIIGRMVYLRGVRSILNAECGI